MIPVFIGGTGRSGTSVLKEVLSVHPRMVSIASELRVIIDPGGGLDLLYALSEGWSPYAADHALWRFRDLLEECASENPIQKILQRLLPAIGISPKRYGHSAIGGQFGEAFYRQRLHLLFDQLVHRRSKGFWIGSPSYRIRPVIEEAGPLGSGEAAEIIGSFFHDLYRNLAGSESATHWIDDTPFNILHAGALSGLFPQLRLVHVYRHPLDVVASSRTKSWGGTEAEIIAIRVSNILAKWLEVRARLTAGTFMEIGLEKFLENTKDRLAEICEFVDVDVDERLLAADGLAREEAHLGRWERDLSRLEADRCRERLQPVMAAYGYV